jgi:hypothetical protein
MTDEVYTHERPGLKARLSDVTAGARDMARAALKEAMTWDAYKWTVLALLTATFLLVALSYGGIRAELAALKQAQGVSPQDLAAIRTELSDMKTSFTQTMSEMKSGLDDSLAKISAKLDARSQPKAATPAPKPVAKPKPQ